MPDLPKIPDVPAPPAPPDLPKVPDVPPVPDLKVPDVPKVPDLPNVPTPPTLPTPPALPTPPSVPGVPKPPTPPPIPGGMKSPSGSPLTAAHGGAHGETMISSRFLLEIDGIEIGVFSEVSGLELTINTETYDEGGQNSFTHKLPGRMSWPNLVFKRGITDSDALFEWVRKSGGEQFEANSNKVDRTTGAVTVLASDGARVRSWSIQAAFPVRWTGPRMDTGSNNPLDEELEVAHHGFKSKTFSA